MVSFMSVKSVFFFFFFSSRRRHTRFDCDWSSDVCSSDLNQGLKLQNVTGYGVLLVKGDLELGGGFQWNGIILVTGSVTLNGGGGNPINIYGQIFSGTSTLTDVTVNGSNTIGYDSCKVKQAMAGSPLKVVNWK